MSIIEETTNLNPKWAGVVARRREEAADRREEDKKRDRREDVARDLGLMKWVLAIGTNTNRYRCFK